MFLMHHSLVSKCLGQRPESKISRVTVDNITFSVFSKVRENSLSNVICSSQPHYAVKRWKYKAGTWMEISDSEQRLERWCLHCSVQMLVSQKLIFHCSLALLYFFFFFLLLCSYLYCQQSRFFMNWLPEYTAHTLALLLGFSFCA